MQKKILVSKYIKIRFAEYASPMLASSIITLTKMPEDKKSNMLMAFLLGEMTGFGFGGFYSTVNENIPSNWI